MFSGSAPAKTILFGEHAVVYGEPAIAIPLPNIRTEVHFIPDESMNALSIESTAFEEPFLLEDQPKDSGLSTLLNNLRAILHFQVLPKGHLQIESDIPVASGLGSGAALSAAVVRCMAKYAEIELSTEDINSLTFQIEQIYHGTPSGIDNTVICYERAVLFRKGEPFQFIDCSVEKLPLIIVDTGVRSETKEVVNDVRLHYSRNSAAISEIGKLVLHAISALSSMNIPEIGNCMNENQALLRAIDVSSPEIEAIINCAMTENAAGAKLTGAGRGGNVIILGHDAEHADNLRKTFKQKGFHVIL